MAHAPVCGVRATVRRAVRVSIAQSLCARQPVTMTDAALRERAATSMHASAEHASIPNMRENASSSHAQQRPPCEKLLSPAVSDEPIRGILKGCVPPALTPGRIYLQVAPARA